MRMEKAVFHKLVELCRPTHDKYMYDCQAHKLKIRTRKANAMYTLSDIIGMTLEHLNSTSTLDRIMPLTLVLGAWRFPPGSLAFS